MLDEHEGHFKPAPATIVRLRHALAFPNVIFTNTLPGDPQQTLASFSYPALVIAHFTVCGPSALPLSTTCWAGLGSAPPR